MAFISLSPELKAKSFTGIENKFITKYMPVLDPLAVKVYIYGLYLCGVSGSFTVDDLAKSLGISEEQAVSCFEYLDEFELVKITSREPFEVTYEETENISGAPKKYKPEKYADFARGVQAIIKGRMISPNEYREYFYLMEEYGFEQSALLMIVNYCVNMKGDDIRVQYIKKVAKSFAAEGAVTAKKVDEKLAQYTFSTPALLKIFAAAKISRRPGIEDDKLYKKWTDELGFSDDAIICASTLFKARTTERIDEALEELYRNKKFDVKEIEYYCKNKNSLHAATLDIAKCLGVYVQSAAPYIENYTGKWCDMGYEADTLRTLASYCFTHGRKSFESMDDFVKELYSQGIISGKAVNSYIEMSNAEEEFLKKVLSLCGLTRRIIAPDKEFLARWRQWEFSDEMILKAAELSAGKNNPLAYMNGVLSAWKSDGVFTPDKIQSAVKASTPRGERTVDRSVIENHYAQLRQIAESRAEQALENAMADKTYSDLHKLINSLNIKLAFAESRADGTQEGIERELKDAENRADERLNELGIDKADFTPRYSCKICGDTGYDASGKPCKCLKKFIEDYKNS